MKFLPSILFTFLIIALSLPAYASTVDSKETKAAEAASSTTVGSEGSAKSEAMSIEAAKSALRPIKREQDKKSVIDLYEEAKSPEKKAEILEEIFRKVKENREEGEDLTQEQKDALKAVNVLVLELKTKHPDSQNVILLAKTVGGETSGM